jgi:hypothetical protein
MTDFVDDLERELLAAARRRSTRERRGVRMHVDARAVSLVALAVVAALVAFVVRPAPDLERPAPDPERPATPPAPRVSPPPVAPLVQPCGSRERIFLAKRTLDVELDLGVLRRDRDARRDRLPLRDPVETWLPVGDYAPSTIRSPIHGLTIVPTDDVRTGPVACGPTKGRGPGACLIYAPSYVRCFTVAQIRGGRAFAIAGDTLIAVMSDPVGALDVDGTRVDLRNNAAAHELTNPRPEIRVLARRLVVSVVGKPRHATPIAHTIAAALDVDANVVDHLAVADDSVVVQAIRPDSQQLTRRIARLIHADQFSAEPPRNAVIEPDTPDVVVVVRMR